MLKVKTISCYGHLILSVLLLWAAMLCAQDALAFDAQHSTKQGAPASVQVSGAKADDSLRQEEQKVSHEAVTFPVTVILQQAAAAGRLPAFAAPTDEKIPSFITRIDRDSLLARLFPIIIQPNAP